MAVVTPLLAKRMLDWVAGGAVPTRPGGAWLALFDQNGSEIALPPYSRMTATFAPATEGTCLIAAPVTFAMTSPTPFMVRTIALFDQQTSGNQMMTFDCSVSVQANGAGFVCRNLSIMLT
jgi:hypothetical protein